MTGPTLLNAELAGAMGDALARRLPTGETDPERLCQAAASALEPLLPGGEGGYAARTAITALRQLVRLPEFGAYLATATATAAVGASASAAAAPGLPSGSPAGNRQRQQLIERIRSTFAAELLHPLLSFSDRCRAGLATAAGANTGPGGRARGNGWPIGLLLLALPALLGLGWLAATLRPRPAEEPPAALGSGEVRQPTLLPLPLPRDPGAGQEHGPGAAPTSPTSPANPASLACLSGGAAEVPAPADRSNYDPRLQQNWKGEPVPHQPELIVLHETVVDEPTAIALFQRRQSDDAQQASYHLLIGRDGRRIRVVDDRQRAFGAGDSALNGLTVQLRADARPSVNNIALHVSLVSPPDGADGEARGHSGYTEAQYRSLATQIALWQNLYGIRPDRVVTHQDVDRSGTRRDPRNLDWQLLNRNLRQQLLACGLEAPTAGLPPRPSSR